MYAMDHEVILQLLSIFLLQGYSQTILMSKLKI